MGKIAEVENILMETDKVLASLVKRVKERTEHSSDKEKQRIQKGAEELKNSIKLQSFDKIHEILMEEE